MKKLLPFNQYRQMPWKNGGGLTREIYRSPEEREDWDFRISTAVVEQSGEFSLFPEHQRHLILLSGNGMILKSIDGIYNLDKTLTPYTFSGNIEIDAQLIDGPCTDFNVFWNSEKHQCKIEILNTSKVAANKNEIVIVFDTETKNSFLISDEKMAFQNKGPYIMTRFVSSNKNCQEYFLPCN